MNWKIPSHCPGSRKMHMILIPFLFCVLPLFLFGKNKVIQSSDPPPEAWEQVGPYLMPNTHPLKQKLDTLFSKTRVIENRNSLLKAGFKDVNSKVNFRAPYKVTVFRHPKMPGYVFKIFTDDRLSYYREQPEYTVWMRRAKGAALIREEIARQGWGAYFKVPIKWVYALPATPKAKSGHLQKNFILVEEDMDILPDLELKKRWKDGTITPEHLEMLFHIVSVLGMRDCCKPANIPICKDGRIAFIDTPGSLHWPVPYEQLLRVLNGKLSTVWKSLIKESEKKGHSRQQ